MTLWTRRPAKPEDENFLVYAWLKSFAHSRYGKDRGAHVDASPEELAYWKDHQPIVMRLLGGALVEVLCDPENENIIWAFACTSGDVVHYVLAKRRFHREGLSGDMFRELLGERLGKACHYTHELVELRREEVMKAGVKVPMNWKPDLYWLARAREAA